MATAPSFVPIDRALPTTVAGQRNFINTLTQRVIADVRDEIIFWEPEAAPLQVLTRGIKETHTVSQYSFDWIEKDPYPREVTVSGSQTSGDVSIELAAGHGGRVGKYWVYKNRRTRENVWVSAITTDTLTVTRGIGGGAAAMLDGDILEFIGAAYESGASKGDLRSTKENREYNLCQIIRTAYGWDGRQMNTGLYGGKDTATERRSQAIEHKKSIELAMFFGGKHDTTGPNGNKLTFMDGVERFIRSNVWDLNGGEPTDRQFVEFMETAMRWGKSGVVNGGGTKWLFASPRWMTIIEGFARDKIQYRPSDQTVGLSVGTYQTVHGTLKIVREPIFNGEHGSYAFLLDMKHIKYVSHEGRDTQLIKNIQANDVDGSEEEYKTDCSIEVQVEGAHALLKNCAI